MKAWLLQIVLVSSILYLYYHLILRNRNQYQFNRFYLLASLVVSLVIPFLSLDITLPGTLLTQPINNIGINNTTQSIFPLQEPNALQPGTPDNPTPLVKSFVTAIYISGILILLYSLLSVLFRLARLARKNERVGMDNIRIILTNENDTPFTFFHFLFWNRKVPFETEPGITMFKHEKVHIEQGHSYDMAFMHLIMIFGWFNPFFYLLKKELVITHEFIADEYVTNDTDKTSYAKLLLAHTMGGSVSILTGFGRANSLQRRIKMLSENKSMRHPLLMLLSLSILSLFILSFRVNIKYAPVNIPKPNDAQTQLTKKTGQKKNIEKDPPVALADTADEGNKTRKIPDKGITAFNEHKNDIPLADAGKQVFENAVNAEAIDEKKSSPTIVNYRDAPSTLISSNDFDDEKTPEHVRNRRPETQIWTGKKMYPSRLYNELVFIGSRLEQRNNPDWGLYIVIRNKQNETV